MDEVVDVKEVIIVIVPLKYRSIIINSNTIISTKNDRIIKYYFLKTLIIAAVTTK